MSWFCRWLCCSVSKTNLFNMVAVCESDKVKGITEVGMIKLSCMGLGQSRESEYEM